MEIREGDVELTTQPLLLIDGKKISETKDWRIEREFAKLLKKVAEMRLEIQALKTEVREWSGGGS